MQLREGLGEFMGIYEPLFGVMAVYDSLGQQVYPHRPYVGEAVFKLVIDGLLVGYLRAATEQSATLVGHALVLHLRTQYWQKQHSHTQARLIEEIKIRTELEEALKFMELKALQSQVNPHFLFNTLTTMAGLALFEGAEETNALLQALSRLLRYSLRRIGQSVNMSEELSNVKDYLAIQRVRFGERILITISVEDDVLPAQIPVLTLQPLVENAIIHGLESREEGHLSLIGYKQGDFVTLEVIDNGTGIHPERLAQIRNSSVDLSGRGHTTGIGLDNVHKRLQHFFGSTCELHIDSELGQGTCVALTIPYVV